MTAIHKTPYFMQYTKDVGAADSTKEINFKIALKIRNTEWINKQLKDTSDPKSANYGKQLTKEELDSMTLPSQEHFDKVETFLRSRGLESSREGDQLKVHGKVGKIESLFNTSIHKFEKPDGGKSDDFIFKRHGNFIVPNEIADCVDLVTGF
ncbi:hypothetical protein DLAC_04652 [Tieghemostelium lacteum]|uniref:Peptidase S53 activation domain-containing protein n=1 Tax=Tieghemostelium lacteum TaxID=361077 RepID=A0A151ZKB5_TIELA|nr:hypothetical protein DLAC_04652 [Tieghemostelium lacteum]|eukprot:KYQ94355.1 hypothetical protein DLAC_04652 [Tieghemostelium lacteum]